MNQLADASAFDRANAIRWAPDDPHGHVESHFVKANSPDGRRALWIKHTLFAPRGEPDRTVAEVWAVAFDRERPGAFPLGAKRSMPVADARWTATPFRFEATGSVIEHAPDGSLRLHGAADDERHRLRWSLRLSPHAPPFRPFPVKALYRAPFPRAKTVTPCPDGLVGGELEIDGESWNVDGWAGMQGHNWGRSHADAYVWMHGNGWEGGGERVWVEALSGRIQLGPVMTPWLSLAAIHIDGRTLRFQGPRTIASRRTDPGYHGWRFAFRRHDAELQGEVRCATREMAGLHYAHPDGRMTHCLNSKLASGELTLRHRGESRVLRSDRIALEVGTYGRDHGVRMLL